MVLNLNPGEISSTTQTLRSASTSIHGLDNTQPLKDKGLHSTHNLRHLARLLPRGLTLNSSSGAWLRLPIAHPLHFLVWAWERYPAHCKARDCKAKYREAPALQAGALQRKSPAQQPSISRKSTVRPLPKKGGKGVGLKNTQ